MELAAKLSEFVSAFFKSNPNINYGGCGVFAAELGTDLQQLGYDTRCVVFGTGGWGGLGNQDLTQLATTLEDPSSIYDWNDEGVELYHVMLEVEGKGEHFLVDGEQVYPPDTNEYNGRGRFDGYLTIPLMQEMVKDASAWNSAFPRKSIPRVQRTIKQFVEDIKNASV